MTDGNVLKKSNQRLSKEQALQKLRQFCAYSERCHADVVNKLYELNQWKNDHDEIIATLIVENYLNEERYAKLFAGGHFRQKQWGRNKIIQALKQKNISSYCIKKGMMEIEEEEYQGVMGKLFNKKWESLKSTSNRFAKMRKVSDFLVQRGFEPHLIQKLLNKNHNE